MHVDHHIYKYEPLEFLPRNRYFIINSIKSYHDYVIELRNEYCFHVNTTRDLAQYNSVFWYQNGKHINTNYQKYNSTVLTKQNGELMLTLEISNVSGNDLGDYVGVISGNVYDLTRWCNEYASSFVPDPYYLLWFTGIYKLPFTIFYSSIEMYSKCIQYFRMHITSILLLPPQ